MGEPRRGELFEVRELDRRIYEERLRDFLPQRLLDMHAHVWLDRFHRHGEGEFARTVSWPARVARENPIEDHLESYRLLFPGKQVTSLIFSNVPGAGDDHEGMNRYVAEVSRRHGLPALLFSHPAWSAEELERRVQEGGFLGIKSYLSLAPAYLPRREIRIYDYFPPHQLEAMDRRGRIVMLHIPRDSRLGDPVNLAQLLEIEERWPRLQLIVAHVGRAYCDEDVGGAFEALAGTRRMRFDFSANTNARVFERLIRAVGPKRVLFGSDLPILRMRMRRICEAGRYVNLVPKGLYGDVSGDPNMREVEGEEAGRLTFFMYEELLAFRQAAEAAGLSREDLEDVFHRNGERMLEAARRG